MKRFIDNETDLFLLSAIPGKRRALLRYYTALVKQEQPRFSGLLLIYCRLSLVGVAAAIPLYALGYTAIAALVFCLGVLFLLAKSEFIIWVGRGLFQEGKRLSQSHPDSHYSPY